MTDAKPRADEKEAAQFRRAAIESLKTPLARATRASSIGLCDTLLISSHGPAPSSMAGDASFGTVLAGLRYFLTMMNWSGEYDGHRTTSVG
jgi:hypothetical protein